ncbi:MAG: LysE/ArgO family amino acid transporter [Candidatus Rickettsia vulgarisii]
MHEIITASLHGIFLAFGLIIPLGVQNVFVFNQGASHKDLKDTLPSIITAALCDTILICLAVLGVSLLILELAWLKLTIFIIGFFFLIYMGYVTWKSATNDFSQKGQTLSGKKQILFAASVSLLNPHAIIDTIVVIGSNAINYESTAKIAYTISCIIISWCWFFALAMAGHYLHKLDNSSYWIKNINKLAALIIWGIAAYILHNILLMVT